MPSLGGPGKLSPSRGYTKAGPFGIGFLLSISPQVYGLVNPLFWKRLHPYLGGPPPLGKGHIIGDVFPNNLYRHPYLDCLIGTSEKVTYYADIACVGEFHQHHIVGDSILESG